MLAHKGSRKAGRHCERNVVERGNPYVYGIIRSMTKANGTHELRCAPFASSVCSVHFLVEIFLAMTGTKRTSTLGYNLDCIESLLF